MSKFIGDFPRTFAAILTVVLIIGASAAAFMLFVPQLNKSGKLQVVATFYPLYFFSSEIAGDKADVYTMIPDNIEPHSWEPTPSDLIEVSEAQVLVFNGMGFEPWIDSFLAAIHNPGLIKVDTSVGIPIIPSQEQDHAGGDPHFWLDPLSAKIQVQNILQAFNRADPANATFYTNNADALMQRLDQLNQDFANGLANRTKNAIVTTHEGFNYMAKRFGFDAYAAVGISADQQPSPQDMARLTDLVNGLGLHYVFSEPVYLDAVMEIIAVETGAKVLVLDGVHGRAGVHAHMDYFEIMYSNLDSLKIGLEVVQ
jgi:zinc transport system substrate-binding protein